MFGGSAPEPPLRGVTPLRTLNQSDFVAFKYFFSSHLDMKYLVATELARQYYLSECYPYPRGRGESKPSAACGGRSEAADQ